MGGGHRDEKVIWCQKSKLSDFFFRALFFLCSDSFSVDRYGAAMLIISSEK